jgi:hypothetical protein
MGLISYYSRLRADISSLLAKAEAKGCLPQAFIVTCPRAGKLIHFSVNGYAESFRQSTADNFLGRREKEKPKPEKESTTCHIHVTLALQISQRCDKFQ